MTNQVFYFPRIVQHARANFNEKKRTYFWHFTISAMIYFIILLMIVHDRNPKYELGAQMLFYYTGLYTTGSIFALRYFSQLARTQSALLLLAQPVSIFEKWLFSAFMTLIIYPVIYTIIYLAMTVSVLEFIKFNSVDGFIDLSLFIPLKNIDTQFIDISFSEQLPLWISYISVCGYALTTCALFKRFPIIKGIALGFGLFLLFVFLIMEIRPKNMVLFYWFNQSTNGTNLVTFIVGILVWVMSPILMWWASFRALKERDL